MPAQLFPLKIRRQTPWHQELSALGRFCPSRRTGQGKHVQTRAIHVITAITADLSVVLLLPHFTGMLLHSWGGIIRTTSWACAMSGQSTLRQCTDRTRSQVAFRFRLESKQFYFHLLFMQNMQTVAI